MGTGNDDLTSEQKRLLEKLQSTAARHGIAAAWRSHVREVIDGYLEERPSSDSVARFLDEFVAADPDLRWTHPAVPEVERFALRRAIGGGPATPGRTGRRRGARRSRSIHRHPEVKEANGELMECHRNRDFENWAQTVENEPAITFVPRTREGVCNLVKWAKAHGKRVRVSGYRHTWGDFFSNDDEVLVSMLPLDDAEDLPARELEQDPGNELQKIELVEEDEAGGTARVKLGAGVTNEMFRKWLVGGSKDTWKKWTIPLNVIMVEITYGGSNAPICHGAGWNTKTLSDLVEEFEFVNANGETQVVNDPALLTAAAGCFGLLGVVTSLTLRLDPMTYASMKPRAPHVLLTIPPPEGTNVPTKLQNDAITEDAKRAAWNEFVRACEQDYFVEWFWFAYQDQCWVNTWDNDGTKDEAQPYPNELTTGWQAAMEAAAQVANDTIFEAIEAFEKLTGLPVGRTQAKLLGSAAMTNFPKDETIVAPLIDALHFQRGIHNMRVLDMELEIPIPPRADDPSKPDWTICQKAWWDVITHVYERDDSPMRLAMELRITRDSDMLMAPQHGNHHGTAAIEVLTTENTDDDDWHDFMQEIANRWFSYTGPDGNPLNVRPHWAKQWQGLTVRNQDIFQYLKNEAYSQRIPEFRVGLEAIAIAGGYTLQEIQDRFSNALLDELIFT